MFARDMQLQLQQMKHTAHMRSVMDGATNNKVIDNQFVLCTSDTVTSKSKIN